MRFQTNFWLKTQCATHLTQYAARVYFYNLALYSVCRAPLMRRVPSPVRHAPLKLLQLPVKFTNSL